MKDQKKSKSKKAKGEFKETHGSRLATLYESISENNQLFKDAVEAKQKYEDITQEVKELIANNGDESEIEDKEEDQSFFKMRKLNCEQKWLDHQKKQNKEIDELKKQMELEQNITQTEKKERENITKQKDESQMDSSIKSITQVESSEDWWVKNVIQNADEQAKVVNEEEKIRTKIQKDEEEKDDKVKTEESIDSISQNALNVSTASSSPNKSFNNSYIKEKMAPQKQKTALQKEEIAPQKEEIAQLKDYIEKQIKEWEKSEAEQKRVNAEQKRVNAESKRVNAEQARENAAQKTINAQNDKQIKSLSNKNAQQEKEINNLKSRNEMLENRLVKQESIIAEQDKKNQQQDKQIEEQRGDLKILKRYQQNHQKMLLKASLTELIFQKISRNYFTMDWATFKEYAKNVNNEMQKFEQCALDFLQIKSTDWDIIKKQKKSRNFEVHKTLNEIFEAQAIIMGDEEEAVYDRHLFKQCLTTLMDSK